MSTRCVVRIPVITDPDQIRTLTEPETLASLEPGTYLDLYHHMDGYPEGVGKFLKSSLKRWIEDEPDQKYRPYRFLNWLVKQRYDRAFEITLSVHPDIEYLYLVAPDGNGGYVLAGYTAGCQTPGNGQYDPDELTRIPKF